MIFSVVCGGVLELRMPATGQPRHHHPAAGNCRVQPVCPAQSPLESNPANISTSRRAASPRRRSTSVSSPRLASRRTSPALPRASHRCSRRSTQSSRGFRSRRSGDVDCRTRLRVGAALAGYAMHAKMALELTGTTRHGSRHTATLTPNAQPATRPEYHDMQHLLRHFPDSASSHQSSPSARLLYAMSGTVSAKRRFSIW